MLEIFIQTLDVDGSSDVSWEEFLDYFSLHEIKFSVVDQELQDMHEELHEEVILAEQEIERKRFENERADRIAKVPRERRILLEGIFGKLDRNHDGLVVFDVGNPMCILQYTHSLFPIASLSNCFHYHRYIASEPFRDERSSSACARTRS